MLVSIVTPSFNQAEYLERTLCSVLEQAGVSIEYFVIDGGSSDGSVEIIRKYAGRLAGWLSEPDSGQAEAINKGLQMANGEIVAWLNSDDLYLPGAVQGAVQAFQTYPQAGMIFGDAVTIDAEDRLINPLTFGDWGLDELMGFRIICQPAVFMRREALEKVGYLDPQYHYLLDHHLWLRLARVAPVQHVPATWAAARHHAAAKNVAQASGFGAEAFAILAWMREQPDLAARLQRRRRRIEAGAYRLRARYLLDGGLPSAALGAYFQALWRSPRFALQHWQRMGYAALSLLGGGSLAGRTMRQRNRPGPALLDSDLVRKRSPELEPRRQSPVDADESR